MAICYGFMASIDIPTEHIDGAYQTSSSLYRLNAGQYPGKDFFPYLGIGPIFLVYPFFKIAGATVASSMFSTHFLLVLLRFLSVCFLAFSVSKTKKITVASITGSLFLILSPFFNRFPFHLGLVFSPENSLRPIRAFLPYFVAISLYLIIKNNNKKYDYILVDIITSICLLWSNDFGIPTALFTIIFFYGYKIKSKEFSFEKLLFSIFRIFLFANFILYVSTNGHIFNLVFYNFIDVRGDQYWYFSPYIASEKIFK